MPKTSSDPLVPLSDFVAQHGVGRARVSAFDQYAEAIGDAIARGLTYAQILAWLRESGVQGLPAHHHALGKWIHFRRKAAARRGATSATLATVAAPGSTSRAVPAADTASSLEAATNTGPGHRANPLALGVASSVLGKSRQKPNLDSLDTLIAQTSGQQKLLNK